MKKTLLELKSVSKYYTGTQSVVMGLNSVDLSFHSGEFVAITGESGSGKSTLAHIISGILPYESGEMLISGRPTSHYDSGDWERHRREKISFISQNYGILPGSSVLQNVLSALRISGMEKPEAAAKAEELLKLVELWELRTRRAGKLSSGQKQRLSIARALAKPAPILVADEPTGNLDPENSAKVISLLAKAAKERLVILITHDFQEAEGFATRRIVLQDGRVTVDTPLQNFERAEAAAAVRRKKAALSPFVSRLQITGRPVWSVLVLLFFALTAFGVFAFLGTFIMNLDDTSTRIYDDSAFPNGSKTRLVVQRSDLAAMTGEDWENILSVRNAQKLERYGYLADWYYAYREDVDYELVYSVQNRGDDENAYKLQKQTATLKPELFIQTVPMYADGRDFLTAGRLPETMYEVVAVGAGDLIGTTIPVYLHDPKTWGSGSYVRIEAEVVGVTDQGTGLYFADELGTVAHNYMAGGGAENGMYLIAPVYGNFATLDGRIMENDFLTAGRLPESVNEVVVPGAEELIGTWLPCIDAEIVGVTEQGAGVYGDRQIDPALLEDSSLSETERAAVESLVKELFFRAGYEAVELYLFGEHTCALSQTLYERRAEIAQRYEEPVTATLYDLSDPTAEPGDREHLVFLDAVGFNDSTFPGYVNVSAALFERISRQGNSNQVSLTISDYAYTDQVLEELQDMGYLAISVFRQGATQKHPALANQRMTTLQVCLAALAAVVLLQVLVLKELFGIQTESYKLLADMGLGCATAQRSVLWQVLIFTAFGQVLGFGAIFLCGQLGIARVEAILRYLPFDKWLILAIVHLAVSVFTGWLTMGSIKKKVYPQSARQGDLDMDEEAENG